MKGLNNPYEQRPGEEGWPESREPRSRDSGKLAARPLDCATASNHQGGQPIKKSAKNINGRARCCCRLYPIRVIMVTFQCPTPPPAESITTVTILSVKSFCFPSPIRACEELGPPCASADGHLLAVTSAWAECAQIPASLPLKEDLKGR